MPALLTDMSSHDRDPTFMWLQRRILHALAILAHFGTESGRIILIQHPLLCSLTGTHTTRPDESGCYSLGELPMWRFLRAEMSDFLSRI